MFNDTHTEQIVELMMRPWYKLLERCILSLIFFNMIGLSIYNEDIQKRKHHDGCSAGSRLNRKNKQTSKASKIKKCYKRNTIASKRVRTLPNDMISNGISNSLVSPT